MDFELDDDQHALQEVVRDLVDNECPPELVRAVVEGRDDGSGFWKTLVEAEWPGLTVPEEDGGTGASAVELVIALEELGRGADPTPFLATTSQFVPLVRGADPDAAPRAAARGLRRRHAARSPSRPTRSRLGRRATSGCCRARRAT